MLTQETVWKTSDGSYFGTYGEAFRYDQETSARNMLNNLLFSRNEASDVHDCIEIIMDNYGEVIDILNMLKP